MGVCAIKKKVLYSKGENQPSEENLQDSRNKLCPYPVMRLLGRTYKESYKLNSKTNLPIKRTNKLDRQSSKEMQMANRYLKKHATSLAIRGKQIN